jgi:hypothetical protein
MSDNVEKARANLRDADSAGEAGIGHALLAIVERLDRIAAVLEHAGGESS